MGNPGVKLRRLQPRSTQACFALSPCSCSLLPSSPPTLMQRQKSPPLTECSSRRVSRRRQNQATLLSSSSRRLPLQVVGKLLSHLTQPCSKPIQPYLLLPL